MCFSWGLVTTLQSQLPNFGGLVTCRFSLGLFKGGLLSGMILYQSGAFTRHELQLPVCWFFCTVALAGAFSDLLAAAIAGMDGVGGMEGCKW
ncbi:hypothetical protein G647_09906 [Cladophialophora carrionii CBS 160.54]|uniref:Uncharacterized protein n=1 Tax=Cladophialophora carrionii CBS 160.54 TaxID=1279043 RepID=V9DLK9_9EURO|nr:uncharacterized protein G647_09906 [Cladophialophora carrionii CBS 160.54]ETI27223.1 hypothetical protein G647_09906 [Cladophialophora carrionii CBS 160.54]